MSDPLLHFEQLSLRSPDMQTRHQAQMPRTRNQSHLDRLKDVLSSFDRNVLPTEYRPQFCRNLQHTTQHMTHLRDAAIQLDFEGSILQAAYHFPEASAVVNGLRTDSDLAILFQQKLSRRFRTELRIFEKFVTEGHRSLSIPGEKDEIEAQDVPDRMRALVKATTYDLRYRPRGQAETGQCLLDQIEALCNARDDVAIVRSGSRRQSSRGTSSRVSLFSALIGNPSRNDGWFALDALETLPAEARRAKAPEIARIASVLVDADVPAEYIRRFVALKPT